MVNQEARLSVLTCGRSSPGPFFFSAAQVSLHAILSHGSWCSDRHSLVLHASPFRFANTRLTVFLVYPIFGEEYAVDGQCVPISKPRYGLFLSYLLGAGPCLFLT